MADDYAEVNTTLFRESPDPFWTRLRAVVQERGVDPLTSALATCFPDDSSLEFGIVVTPDGDVFEFEFEYLATGNVASGTLARWDRMTDRWKDRPFRAEVEAAFELLARSA